MMEGVTILSMVTKYDVNFVQIAVPIVISAAVGILLGILAEKFTDIDDGFYVALLCCLIGSMVSLHMGISAPRCSVYKVFVDDTVSMTEFCERYEILNQDGLIYEIKERENRS